MKINRSYGIGRFMANVMRIAGTLSTDKIKPVESVAETGLKKSRLHEKTQIPPFCDPKGKSKNVNITT
jgi:hypothetical protein|tara:strand:- start:380 stop:583 length:204 start_codon:yes stop_codon:yes gene_type:complete